MHSSIHCCSYPFGLLYMQIKNFVILAQYIEQNTGCIQVMKTRRVDDIYSSDLRVKLLSLQIYGMASTVALQQLTYTVRYLFEQSFTILKDHSPVHSINYPI